MSSHFGALLKRVALFVIASVYFVLTIACHAEGIVDCVIQGRVRTPSVRGIVVDPTGVPVPDTLVVLEANGEKVRQAKSGTDGKFNLSAPAGTYSFKVTHPYLASIDHRPCCWQRYDQCIRPERALRSARASRLILPDGLDKCQQVSSNDRREQEAYRGNRKEKCHAEMTFRRSW